jgi:hypothetical protein
MEVHVPSLAFIDGTSEEHRQAPRLVARLSTNNWSQP